MRVIVADDHPLFRDALTRLVLQLAPDARVDSAETLAQLQDLLDAGPSCELLLLDLRMPAFAGADASPAPLAQTLALVRAHPDVPTVVVSASDNPSEARQLLDAGACGCLRKSLQPDLLREVLAGLLDGSGLDHPLLTAVADVARAPAAGRASPSNTAPNTAPLTPRQAEVLALLCTGASNKHIARELGLTEGTVKLHVAAVLQALHVSNRTEAAARAHALGWA